MNGLMTTHLSIASGCVLSVGPHWPPMKDLRACGLGAEVAHIDELVDPPADSVDRSVKRVVAGSLRGAARTLRRNFIVILCRSDSCRAARGKPSMQGVWPGRQGRSASLSRRRVGRHRSTLGSPVSTRRSTVSTWGCARYGKVYLDKNATDS